MFTYTKKDVDFINSFFNKRIINLSKSKNIVLVDNSKNGVKSQQNFLTFFKNNKLSLYLISSKFGYLDKFLINKKIDYTIYHEGKSNLKNILSLNNFLIPEIENLIFLINFQKININSLNIMEKLNMYIKNKHCLFLNYKIFFNNSTLIFENYFFSYSYNIYSKIGNIHYLNEIKDVYDYIHSTSALNVLNEYINQMLDLKNYMSNYSLKNKKEILSLINNNINFLVDGTLQFFNKNYDFNNLKKDNIFINYANNYIKQKNIPKDTSKELSKESKYLLEVIEKYALKGKTTYINILKGDFLILKKISNPLHFGKLSNYSKTQIEEILKDLLKNNILEKFTYTAAFGSYETYRIKEIKTNTSSTKDIISYLYKNHTIPSNIDYSLKFSDSEIIQLIDIIKTNNFEIITNLEKITLSLKPLIDKKYIPIFLLNSNLTQNDSKISLEKMYKLLNEV